MRARATELFEEHQHAIHRRTDRMFAALMAVEYVAGIVAAWTLSPRTWSGAESAIHVHVLAAIFLGALILAFPIALAIWLPGRTLTRHAIAIGQMLDSALLIHLSGGRIETHFHVFGSLAFLGFYRDWRVLVSASTVVALDHLVRGIYWPQSVYGVLSVSSYRWLEHTAWVLFEDVFIVLASVQSVKEMREIAEKRALSEGIAQERAASISELRETRAKLAEALVAKDAFMSICGHELKTPLTSLSLQTQLALKAIDAGNEKFLARDRIAKMVNQTDRQVKRLLRLIQDMLDHSRIQVGKLSIHREALDLAGLVEDVVNSYQPMAEADGCSIWFEKGEPVPGRWDRFRIEQVLTNLLTNAVRYGAGKPIEVTLIATAEEARVSVRDHGVGIASGDRDRIFRQFERVAQQTHVTGLGLGLYITKGIVEQHGGSIDVESEPGLGSTFTIRLPLDVPKRLAPGLRTSSASIDSSKISSGT
jgi:signal transduction histidine kinase